MKITSNKSSNIPVTIDLGVGINYTINKAGKRHGKFLQAIIVLDTAIPAIALSR